MQSYTVIVSNEATGDLDEVVFHIESEYVVVDRIIRSSRIAF